VNHAVNITLIIIGIMALTIPPLGVALLVIAFISIRVNHSRRTHRHRLLEEQAAEKSEWERILAYKSLP